MKNILVKNKFILAAIAIILIYLSPYFLLKENAYVYALDNLDGLVATNYFFANNGKIFSASLEPIYGFMHNLPRACFGTEFNIQYLFYFLFTPFYAYVINIICIHFIALFGAYLLVKKINSKAPPILCYSMALCFAMLPYWYGGGITIAGQPLVIYSLIQLYDNPKLYKHYFSLLLYICYSVLFWGGIFFMAAIALATLYIFIKQGRKKIIFLLIIIGFGILYLLSEHHLIFALFSKKLITHRVEFQFNIRTDFNYLFDDFMYYLKCGHYQALTLHYGPLLFIFPIVYLLSPFKKKIITIALVSSLIFICINFLSCKSFKLLLKYFFTENSIFFQFDISRINTLLPIFTLLVLIILSKQILGNNKYANLFLIILLLQIGNCFYSSANFSNAVKGLGIRLPQRDWYDKSNETVPDCSFNKFYMSENFAKLKTKNSYDDIKKSYCISVGINPSVALYNGLKTMDGYMNIYPLSYKHLIFEINKEELLQNVANYSRFNDWGNNCYFFESNPAYNQINYKNLPKTNSSIDYKKLKLMGCKYVISVGVLVNENIFLVENIKTDAADLYVFKIK